MDHKYFQHSDLAKVYCEKCNGCGDCCHGMTDTIHLDPWDIYQLSSGLGKSFEELRAAGILALHEEEGMILPHLRMQDGENGACPLLSSDGRCSIHPFRPGLCRLFPLGRDYDADTRTFRYFIVDNGCDMPGKIKVRISKWLGIAELSEYEKYVSDDTAFAQQLNLFILKVFFVTPYVIPEDGSSDFYSLFRMRLTQARTVL